MNGARIVVADDESILRLDVKAMLTAAGYRVMAEANTGDLAIELAALHQPDLIVMDIKMPGMSGVKASRIIQETYGVPVLLLTAYSDMEFIQEAKKAGVVGYLVKPFTERDLIPAVEMGLAQTQRLTALRSNIRELEGKIQLQRKVQRAKGILMDTCQYSEAEATRRLQSYCMHHRKTLDEVAAQIIKHGRLEK